MKDYLRDFWERVDNEELRPSDILQIAAILFGFVMLLLGILVPVLFAILILVDFLVNGAAFKLLWLIPCVVFISIDLSALFYIWLKLP